MFRRIIFIGLLGIFFTACSASGPANSGTAPAAGGNTAGPANIAANNAPATTNTNSANAAPTATPDNSPKRISFGKGANWGTANVTLAPNAAQLFVVGAKSGQTMTIEASAKDVAINLRKGRAETTEDFGFLNAELQGNGDYVFEVRNSSKKEIKTSIKVTIEGGKTKDDTAASDESDATVKDDPSTPPPAPKEEK